MTNTRVRTPIRDRAGSLTMWVAVAFLLRAAAAVLVQALADRRGVTCLFPDADIYWMLGRAIRAGLPYAVPQSGEVHYALRTPGYPLFLAACQVLFGGHAALGARLVQAALGASCVVFVHRLTLRITGDRRAALVAAALAAVEPYTAAISAVLLSEALFIPLMLLALWGLATLWPGRSSASGGHQPPGPSADAPRRPVDEDARSGGLVLFLAFATGLAFGAGILVKPSWALFPPLALLAWIIAGPRRGRRWALVGSLIVAHGLAAIMAPWWVRNARIYGRFVPTALWAGASLYDGIHPGASGASDMRFLDRPEFQSLGERRLDATLTARSLEFARAHPGRVAHLAAIKAARYWSPWPNEASFRAPAAVVLSALATLPLYGLVAVGLWARRRDARALVLLAGPVLYFAAVHMVFVGSVRYRIPGAVAAMGLAGIGAASILRPRTPLSSGDPSG